MMRKINRLDGPIKWSNRRILGSRLGLMLVYGKDGRNLILKTDVSWRAISGVVVNTPRGALWLYFRNWR